MVYTVKEVADIVSVSEETVRRWIRSKKIKATIESKKQGYLIDEKELYKVKKPEEKTSEQRLRDLIFMKRYHENCLKQIESEIKKLSRN